MIKTLRNHFSFLIRKKLSYDKNSFGLIYKLNYKKNSLIAIKSSLFLIAIGNLSVYVVEKRKRTFKTINTIALGIGVIFGLLGFFTYYFLTFRAIKTIKIHQINNIIQIERVEPLFTKPL